MSSDFRQGMMVGALLTALVLVAYVAIASAQISLSVFGVSKHTQSGFCEVNPGFGLNYELNDRWRFLAVKYKNSLCRESDAYGAAYQPFRYGRFAVGAALLRLTGYSASAMYVPIPTVSYIGNGYAIDAIVVAKESGGVIGIGLRVPIW